MIDVTISLGSNIQPVKQLYTAYRSLCNTFTNVRSSPVYRSTAHGFTGNDFLNAVVVMQTTLTLIELQKELRAIEDAQHRQRIDNKFCDRTLDIDILTYGTQVETNARIPHPDIRTYAFVACPLADLLPQQQCPGSDETFATIAADCHNHGQCTLYASSLVVLSEQPNCRDAQ